MFLIFLPLYLCGFSLFCLAILSLDWLHLPSVNIGSFFDPLLLFLLVHSHSPVSSWKPFCKSEHFSYKSVQEDTEQKSNSFRCGCNSSPRHHGTRLSWQFLRNSWVSWCAWQCWCWAVLFLLPDSKFL